MKCVALLTLRVMYYAKRSLLLQFIISSWLSIMLRLIAGHCRATWWARRLTKMPARAFYHCSKASPLSSRFQYHYSWLRRHARCESVLRASLRLRTAVLAWHVQWSLSHDDAWRGVGQNALDLCISHADALNTHDWPAPCKAHRYQ
jgi:hypothetical protein